MAFPAPQLVAASPAPGRAHDRRAGGRLRPIETPAVDFDTLYQLEFASMVALARAICGDHELAEDLAQEAFSRAHTHWPKVSRYDRPGAWLRRVTINLALSRRRRLQRELAVLRRSADDAATRPRSGDDPADGPDREVWNAVRRLPPKQRAAVALFYQHDLSTADIADALGCTVSTATSHLSQARAKLAELLNEPVDDDRPTAPVGDRRGAGR